MNLNLMRSELEKALTRRGMTQVEFAQRYGLSHSWVNKYLNRKITNSRLDTAQRLQDAIDDLVLKGN